MPVSRMLASEARDVQPHRPERPSVRQAGATALGWITAGLQSGSRRTLLAIAFALATTVSLATASPVEAVSHVADAFR